MKDSFNKAAEDQNKTCSKCGKCLPVNRFQGWNCRTSGKFKVSSICKDCKRKLKNDWQKNNKSKVLEYRERYRIKKTPDLDPRASRLRKRIDLEAKQNLKDIEDVKKTIKHIRQMIMKRDGVSLCRSCEKVLPLSEMSDTRNGGATGRCKTCERKRIASYKREFCKNNPEKMREIYRRRYELLKLNPSAMLLKNIRRRISHVMQAQRAGEKTQRTIQYLGCDAKQLAAYIESQFVQGMEWGNYGKWHVDHIRPCASYNLASEGDRRLCFHYSNLQPMWAKDNIRKHANISVNEHQPSLII